MKKNTPILTILLLMLVAISSILFFTKEPTEASPDLVDPSIYEYTENSKLGAWYDEKSGCIIFQTLDRAKSTDNYYRTYLIEFSRIKDDVKDPTIDIYKTDKEANLGENDPHYYEETTSENYTQEINGKYYERQYFSFDKSTAKYEERIIYKNGTKYNYATFVIDKELVLSCIEKNYPEWYEDLTKKTAKKEAAWLGVDNVICVHYPELTEGSFYGDYWSGFVYTTAKGQTKGSGEIFRWSNWEGMENYFESGIMGSFETGSGVYTHFNSYVNITTDIPQENLIEASETLKDEVVDTTYIIKDHVPTNVEKGFHYNQSYDSYAAPFTYTWNNCEEFNLGEAIPSTETYQNYMEAASWYGSIKIEKHKITHKIEVPYVLISSKEGELHNTIIIRSKEELPAGNHDGLHVPETYESFDGTYYSYICWYYSDNDTVEYYTGSYTFEETEYYYAIKTINLYGYEYTTVTNTFSTTEYMDNKIEIPYNVTINNENVNSQNGDRFKSTTFVADTNAHISYKSDTKLKAIVQRTKEDINSDKEAYEYVVSLIADDVKQRDITTLNDSLEINNVKYMDENNLYFAWNKGNDRFYEIGAQDNDKISGETDIKIPMETKNGEYPTSLKTKYSSLVAGSKSVYIRYSGNDNGHDGIKEEYLDNEPIIVHTPVISPISIVGEKGTQLMSNIISDEEQLILDNTYTLSFNWKTYFHYKGYTQENFPDYVQKKEVRFPFAVVVDGVSYNIAESTGYTQWIDVGNVDSFEFYLPTWAKEGVYGSTEYEGYNLIKRGIEAKVYAVNCMEEEKEMWQLEANTDRVNYVATYEYPVQISGVIYDFQVVSINDPLVFGNLLKGNAYNFATNKEEKNNEIFNRFGESSVRYTLDGLITNNWSELNTLPFTKGSSKYASAQGYLKAGHKIGFTIKTISGLNGKDDTIKITPRYRYVSKDGVEKEVSVYYTLGNQPFTNIYNDDYYRSVMIGSEYFYDCYYDYGEYDTIDFTAKYYDTNTNDILYRNTDSFTSGVMTLFSSQKLLTGNEEELFVNRNANSEDALRYNDEMEYLNATTLEQFQASMQTWYGSYKIPSNLYVCEKYTDGTDALTRLADKTGVVTPNSDIWLKEGYLVLSFDIETYVDGKYEHLTYYGSGIDMWETENGGNKTIEITSSLLNVEPTKIQLRDGDIAIINLEKKLSDKYSIGILYLN